MARPPSSRLLAILGLLWFGYGCWAYALLQIRYADFVTPIPAAAMQAVDELPVWVTAAWGLGLGAGLAASVLTFWRARWARIASVPALVGLTVSLACRFRSGALPEGAVIPAISILLAGLIFWLNRLKPARG